MAGQSEPTESKKRKSTPRTTSERKRKRPASNTEKPLDSNLLRILTGDDNKTPQTDHPQEPEKETTQNGASKSNNEDVSTAQQIDPSSTTPTNLTNWPAALPSSQSQKLKLTVLLEQANLETVKQPGRSGGHVLLNSDDHRHILRKTNREANDARPDITHQCLLTLMDSPLNKAGRLKVYIRTANNVLIDVHPQTRIPRTMRRFSGLMAELLEKLKVRGTSGSTPLFKVIKNPITAYLPVGTRKVVCTYNTDNTVDMRAHAAKMAEHVKVDEEEDNEEVNVLYVIGAMAHGKVTEDWADEYICISEYPLSAATVCARLTYAYETLFGIL